MNLALNRYFSDKIKSSRLTWHGGGEPTLSWPLIRNISCYHRRQSEKKGLEPQLSIVSNGIWLKHVFNWVVKKADRIIISCDGPKDIHDKQRPLKNGNSSSSIVFSTLRSLAETGANFGIRATITENNANRMTEMVQFFHELCRPKTLQFERLAVCGRCEKTGIQPGLINDYIDNFKKAFDLANHLGINLGCSGVRIFRRTEKYCGAAGRTLCVTPEGLLTTCHRVDNKYDPLATGTT